MNKDRAERVKKLHEAESQQWGFHTRDRDRVWILKIEEPVHYQSQLKGYEFDSRWLSLAKDGTVTIHASKERPYAWDGCTPKLAIGNKQFIIGSPDGYQDIDMALPVTGKATLIHDAFYQYLHIIPVPKLEVDRLFRDILKEAGFVLWPLYYLAVRLFGGWSIKQEGLDGVYYAKYRPIYLENAENK